MTAKYDAIPILTLIIPVYNVSPFLPRCLESLSTEHGPTTEVILINDGSTDDSSRMLDEYVRAHPEARLINQENAGLSAARNTGLDNARGRYVAFVDSDDYYDPGYYQRLTALCEDHSLDMAIGNASYHFEGRRDDYPIYTDSPPTDIIHGAEFLKFRLNAGTFLHMVWMFVYRREFIEKHSLRFVPRILHEDIPWTTRALLWAETVMYDATAGYHYRQRVRHFAPPANDQRLAASIESYMYITKDLAALVDHEVFDEELRRLIRWRLVDEALAIFHKTSRFSTLELRRAYLRRFRDEGLLGLMWSNAVEWRHRRRIARNYLKTLVARRNTNE